MGGARTSVHAAIRALGTSLEDGNWTNQISPETRCCTLLRCQSSDGTFLRRGACPVSIYMTSVAIHTYHPFSESSLLTRGQCPAFLAIVPRYGCSRLPGGGSPYLNRWLTPPVSKSHGLKLHCPWANCEVQFGRQQELGRHILCHLPDCFCCPDPDCPWRGHRKETLNMHISKGKCRRKPKSKEECTIYDAKLITSWIRNDTVSIEIAEMFALKFVQERAKELGKVDLWTDPWGYDDKT